MSNAACYDKVREMRWPEGTTCPHCRGVDVIKRGRDDTQPDRQRYECKPCGKRFDDLTGTVFEGHHQPLKTWILCLYFMGLNLSNRQIALELGINEDIAQQMTTQLREGIEEKKHL